jgi:hypothetical protein
MSGAVEARACYFIAAGVNGGPIPAPSQGYPAANCLCTIVVTQLGTGICTFWDSSSGGGNVLFVVPASAPVGTPYNLYLPVGVGIYFEQGANGPGLTVSWR